MKKIFTLVAICFAVLAMNAQNARVILTAGDVWGDGSGYQMLLDPTAQLYGSVIPETGALSTNCTGNEAIYNQFGYKIPQNADGNCDTQNMVSNNSVAIDIPAGTYDWCITNPTPNDRIWIASANGNAGGRQNDYTFQANKTYTFVVSIHESGNDNVDVTITDGTTGISEFSDATFSIYPNPASTVLNVMGTDIQSVDVLNLLGQSVITTDESTVNVSNLTNGAYFVRVTFMNGTISTQKFIKK